VGSQRGGPVSDDGQMARSSAPLDWSPETEEGYEAARAYLKERFAAWCADNGTVLDSDVGEAPIHYKWGYVDGHLTRWTCRDLDEVYLELHPAKVMVEEYEFGSVLDEAKAFVAFLSETGLFDEQSDDPEVLLRHLDRIEARFRKNMADTSRYSFGKRFWVAAAAEGVQLDDEKAVQSFMEAFNARSRSEREAVLGRMPQTKPGRATGRFTPPGTKPRPKQALPRKRRGR
jgi:hypothetical protein